jgi:small neutral amino acid transporter SnatA (MarC family)
MTVWAVLAGVVGATNPFRRRTALDVARLRTVVAGAAAAAAALVACAVAGATLRGALDVSAPNARITAGLVLAVVGLHAVVARVEQPAPPAGGDDAPAAWLVPVAFPALFRPDLALVAFASEAGDLVPVTVAVGTAFALVALWWHVRTRAGSLPAPVTATERGLGALLGAVTVLAAIRLVLDGVFAL